METMDKTTLIDVIAFLGNMERSSTPARMLNICDAYRLIAFEIAQHVREQAGARVVVTDRDYSWARSLLGIV